MTLQHFLRTLMIAALGAVALAIATQAKAEGGEGSSIILPQEPDSAASESSETEKAIVAEEETTDLPQSKKLVKAPTKDIAKKSPKVAALIAPEGSAADKQKPETAAAAGGRKKGQVQEAGVEQTAALAPVLATVNLLPRQSDAVRASALKPLIARYASENDLPYELADAVVRLESRYNAGARNGPNMGLTQVNFRTAQSLGYKGDASGLLDAETNLRYGLKYLAQAYKLAGGDTCGAILRYQFGHRTQTMTGASRVYCAKVKTITATAE
jgi:soluble lytic murein transglycosylase-like protein